MLKITTNLLLIASTFVLSAHGVPVETTVSIDTSVVADTSVAIDASSNSLSSAAAAPTVNLGYVCYQGTRNTTSGINTFRGIPYAQPPLGSLRWRAPLSIESGNTFAGALKNATIIQPACYLSVPPSLAGIDLPGYTNPPQGQSENCLTLDVLVPTNPVSKSLPVIFQIHGGGYTLGNAQTMPGDAMVHLSNGKVIYVSIQYRLGIFGFLAGTQVAADGVLNAGILDQRAALDWVQRNIAKFGGDPKRVTIWGGSAGGASVGYHLTSAGGSGTAPFSAAIVEYPWWAPMWNSTLQNSQYALALKLSGCSTLTCLRGKSSSAMATLGQAVADTGYGRPGNAYGTFGYGPVVDGTYIKALPHQEFKNGNFHKVPVITDHTLYEGLLVSNSSMTTEAEETQDAKILFPSEGSTFFSKLYSLYPISSFPSVFYQRLTWFGDFTINCPTYEIAKAFKNANSSPNTTAVFKMQFNAGSLIHTASAPFLASSDISYPGVDNALATKMSSYWVSFAVTGDPNPLRSSTAPFWPSYKSGSVSNATLVVTDTTISTASDIDVGPRCDFWSSEAATVGN